MSSPPERDPAELSRRGSGTASAQVLGMTRLRSSLQKNNKALPSRSSSMIDIEGSATRLELRDLSFENPLGKRGLPVRSCDACRQQRNKVRVADFRRGILHER